MNMQHIPMELSFVGIYVSPLMPAVMLGLFSAWLITRILNRFDLARFVWYPPLFFLALVVICTSAVGKFIIPF